MVEGKVEIMVEMVVEEEVLVHLVELVMDCKVLVEMELHHLFLEHQ
jgi:hypothetical protein